MQDARKAQEAAKKQFESALEQFIAVTNFEGGDLERQYRKLKDEYDESESRAKDVRKRIADVEQAAGDLFKEWEKELGQYKSAGMRRTSQRQLQDTKSRYQQLIASMKRAERKLDPVLGAFRDACCFSSTISTPGPSLRYAPSGR